MIQKKVYKEKHCITYKTVGILKILPLVMYKAHLFITYLI